MKLNFLLITLILFSLFLIYKTENDWEQLYLSIPNQARAYQYLQFYTSMPHVAGTYEDYQTAVFTKQKFEEFGLEAEIEEFETLLNYPLERTLEIVSPQEKKFVAPLQEEYISVDPASADDRIIPTFNGYSPSADVTGELIYINYGRTEDHDYLESIGVNVSGKILIARYGSIFRGVKAMIAQMKGAIGLIIYSDPLDDGYSRGSTYPSGPWRPETGVQRGSVQFLSLCAGDPRNPECNKANLKGKRNPSPKGNPDYTTIPTIPVQPISWGDAEPFLSALTGPVAPESWQGGLNFTYHIGSGPIVVHLKTVMNWTITPIWNVIAKIKGIQQDRVVLIGNHRDAWVYGAADPNGGTSAMLEVARGLGELYKQGWRPQRTIIFCSWDGEEYGLLGSTFHAESHSSQYVKQAIAYLNVDVAVTGPNFGVGATPSLNEFIRNITKEIIDPNTGKPLYDVWNHYISVLGSGSDFTSFLDHLGIPSVDFGFNGDYGVYHSTYDSFAWITNWADPTFAYFKTSAQLLGLMAMRLADSDVLPYNFTDYTKVLKASVVRTYELLEQNQGSDLVDLSALNISVTQFEQAAIKSLTFNTNSYNDRLMLTERNFIDFEGLPERPWYKHVIQAPGLYLGYGSDIFPGLSQAIRDHNWDLAQSQCAVVSSHIQQAANYLSTGINY
eukprot:TRINITY_DN602_c0_g1_i1.p1 TRINITY_DN602_c0_g1~~TRINITY_DN602_c0_g1_i1.p1  ORF type:complete len:671 (+),score=332.17 TRINITY_DN602_c0_g1_i1:117-2129(+)